MRPNPPDHPIILPGSFLVAIILHLVTACGAYAQNEPQVFITGGADPSQHNYSWTIKHNYHEPIVFVEFPHFHADVFNVPDGWKTEVAGMIGNPSKLKGHFCRAMVDSPDDGISSLRPATFGMRVAPLGAPRGMGNVTVRFADGKEVIVHAVSVPVKESLGGQFLPLIGLGTIFGIYLLVRAIRGSKTGTTSAEAARLDETNSPSD